MVLGWSLAKTTDVKSQKMRVSRLFRRAALTWIECFDRAASHTAGPFYFLGITCPVIITMAAREPPSWIDFGADASEHKSGAKTGSNA